MALRRQDATGVMDFGEAVQRASYIASRSLSDPRVYVDVTRALGLEPAAVAAAFAGPAARFDASATFAKRTVSERTAARP